MKNIMIRKLGELLHRYSFVLKNNTGNQATKGTASAAFGVGVIAIGEMQTVLGRYNTPDERAQFIIGSGESDENRNTAFHVDENGVSKMAGGDVVIFDESTDCYIPVFVVLDDEVLPVRQKHIA